MSSNPLLLIDHCCELPFLAWNRDVGATNGHLKLSGDRSHEARCILGDRSPDLHPESLTFQGARDPIPVCACPRDNGSSLVFWLLL